MAAVRAVSYGEFNINHDWVKFNGSGNLESHSSISTDDLCDTVSKLAEYALENENEFSGILDFDFEEESE
jgi:hypothetical protein